MRRPSNLLAILLAFASELNASPCGSWQPGSGSDGVSGAPTRVNSITNWDPDGSGPRPSQIVLGGYFNTAGGRPVSNIATWDGQSWSSIGQGFDDEVFDVEGLPNGELLAVGRFYRSGSTPMNRVAKWNGTNWVDLGGEIDSYILGAVTLPDGSFMVSGYFTRIGGVPARQVAHYRQGTWHPMATGLTGNIHDLSLAFDGSIYASGYISLPGAFVDAVYARWNGTAWSAVPYASFYTTSLASPAPASGMYAGGSSFVDAGNGTTLEYVAVGKFNGVSWDANIALPEIQGGIFSVTATPDRTFACGTVRAPFTSATFEIDQSGARHILGGPTNISCSLIDSSNRLVVAGYFSSYASMDGSIKRARRVMAYDGSTWSTLGEGFDGIITAIFPTGPDSAIVAGNFSRFASTRTGTVAKWMNGHIQPLQSILDREVLAISTTVNGNILAGLTAASNSSGSSIRQFDGSTWSDLGPSLNSSVRAILPLSDGTVIVGGDFIHAGTTTVNRIARLFNGQWLPLEVGLNGNVNALTRLPNGNIIAGGEFTFAGATEVSNVALWDGQWRPLDRGVSRGVNALATMPDGSVIAGGSFTFTGNFSRTLNRVARWTNNAWQQMGQGFNGAVYSFSVRGNRLIAVGDFTASGSTPLYRIAEWDGTTWRPLDAGVGSSSSTIPSTDIYAKTVAILPNQNVLVGGAFQTAGGLPSDAFAWWRSCPAEFNCDGTTDFFDYLDFVAAFAAGDPTTDLNADGVIDLFDYLDFVDNFNRGC